MIRRPPRSTRTDTLFPYTTLFRACICFPGVIRRLLSSPSANYSSDILRGHAERMQEREPKWRGRTLAMEFWLGTVLVGGHSAANGMAPRRAADYSGAPSGMGPGVSGDFI